MADIVNTVESGFWNSIGDDRTYYAEDMNRPYRRLVSNGVFADNVGSNNDDLRVTATGGMQISVNSGSGIFGDKWFENQQPIIITVPSNQEIYGRIDSVIVQVDKRDSGRASNIVYREGEAANVPQPPEINTVPDIVEYRVANIRVGNGVTSLRQQDITDLRGSDSCPWVTGLIEQVNTSDLFEQYRDAYFTQYERYSQEYEDYVAEKTLAFDDFMESLTEQLNAPTSILWLQSRYTAAEEDTQIPVQIAGFDSTTDLLFVYINGIYAAENEKYTISSNDEFINLYYPVGSGTEIYFLCLKSVIASDVTSVSSMIRDLSNRLAIYESDSGWQNIVLAGGVHPVSGQTPQIRKKSGIVYISGAVTGFNVNKNSSFTIAGIDPRFIPSHEQIFVSPIYNGTLFKGVSVMSVLTNGVIRSLCTSVNITSDDDVVISCQYCI